MKRILYLLLLLVFVACGSAETTMEQDEEMAESAEMMADDAALADEDTMMSDDAAALIDGDMNDNPDAMTDEDAMADDDTMLSDDAAMHDDDAAMSDDEAMMSDDDTMHDDDAAMTDDDAMMSDDDAMGDEAAAMDDDAMVNTSNLPVYQTLPLVNAHTGETFTLADFAGKTVFVEPMATWCTNCLRQLGNVQVAKAESADDVVFIGLSLETTLTRENLAEYANRNGFDFIWAVLTPDMVRELAGEFGQTITNPPSTPHFIIRPNGTVANFATGIESATDLLEQIELAKNS